MKKGSRENLLQTKWLVHMWFTNWLPVKQQLVAESKNGRVMCFRWWSCDPKVLACKSIRTTHKRGWRLYLGAGSRSICASVGSLKSGSKLCRHLSQRLSSKHTKPEGLKLPLLARWQRELLDMTEAAHKTHVLLMEHWHDTLWPLQAADVDTNFIYGPKK